LYVGPGVRRRTPGASRLAVAARSAFYAYAYPEPPGYADQPGLPPAARYTEGEFLLPYEAVAAAPDPDRVLAEFLDATYAAAADLAGWDRAALEDSWPHLH